MKKALITGVAGQDGSYLTELLLGRGYEVHGLVREGGAHPDSVVFALATAESGTGRLVLHRGDVTESELLRRLFDEIRPDECYNLASQGSVAASFDHPVGTGEVNGLAVARLLHALRETAPDCRFYQASSSEMFGVATETPQTEATPLQPRNPYACAKTYGHMLTVSYREAFGLHASSGILFNHESPRREDRFVTRKITRAVAAINAGTQDSLTLGNLDVERDWGFAGDYVEAMWLMVQHEHPGDYVVATGSAHSVREFVERAFARVDLDYREYVETDPRFLRPIDQIRSVGDASKIRRELGWEPRVGFEELVKMMVDADLERIGAHA